MSETTTNKWDGNVASGDGWTATVRRARGSGWEASITFDHGPTWRFPEHHEGITGMGEDQCKRWVIDQLTA